jgi:hypothetical protein
MRAPAFGMAILTPVLLAGAVAASPERPSVDVPVAAAPPAAPAPQAVAPRPLAEPAAGLRVPAKAMSAYRKAEQTMATAAPGCGISWNLLAGIGRIETATAGGAATAVHSVYARPTAPTKFASATWSRFAADGDGDGKSDPKNPFDATLATAKHLCSGGQNFRNQSQALKALLRYNDSMAFAANVLGWAAAYATGTSPLNLPPIYGPVPVLPYLPGLWSLGAATQAGYLLPAPAAENPVPALSAAPPVVVVLPEPAPLVEVPAAAASVAPVAAPAQAPVGSAVAPQVALQGDRPRPEPTEAFSAPPPPAPAPQPPAPQVPEPQLPELQLPAPEPPAVPESIGRQAGRAQADIPVQASGGNDGGGGEGRSGGARRGGRG